MDKKIIFPLIEWCNGKCPDWSTIFFKTSTYGTHIYALSRSYLDFSGYLRLHLYDQTVLLGFNNVGDAGNVRRE